jgi:hypothetical protein
MTNERAAFSCSLYLFIQFNSTTLFAGLIVALKEVIKANFALQGDISTFFISKLKIAATFFYLFTTPTCKVKNMVKSKYN